MPEIPHSRPPLTLEQLVDQLKAGHLRVNDLANLLRSLVARIEALEAQAPNPPRITT